MPSAFTPASVLNHKSVGQTGGGQVAECERPAQLLESTDLLQGNKAVGILHNGSLYRLQATKLGKLILTK
ncbi:MAG: hemin uptake protein HemP [Variovorax sp.]